MKLGRGLALAPYAPLRVAVELSELCVLCLCLLQDGDVRIGILPKNQEVLISSAGLGGVTGHRVRTTELEMGERADWFIQHNAPMVEVFWELGGCFLALMRSKIGFSAHINGVQIRPIIKAICRQAKLREATLRTSSAC